MSSSISDTMSQNDRHPVPSGRCRLVMISAVIVIFTAATTVTVLFLLFGPSVLDVDQLKPNGHLEKNPLATSRALNTGMVRENRHAIGPSMSMNDVPSSTLPRSESILNGDQYAANHNHGNRKTIESDEVIANTAVETLWPYFDSRRKHSNMLTDKWSTEQEGWTSNHDSYDSIYNGVGADNSHKQVNDLVDGNVPNMVLGTGLDPYQPIAYNPYLRPPPVISLITEDRPSITDNQPSSTNYHPPGMDYRPATKSVVKYSIPFPQNNVITMPSKIDLNWRTIGLVALIKLGLLKLKTFTIMNVVFFLLFNLKIFLLVVFLKYQIFVKFMKFVMFLISPLFLLPLLPILTMLFSPTGLITILSIPGQILQTILTMLNVLANPMSTSSSSFSSYSRPSNILPNSRLTRPSVLVPNNMRPVNRPPPSSGESTSSSDDSDDESELESKSDVFDSPYRGNYESLKMYDPALEIFRKLLDSEKCVERIACQMAVAEKSSITPSWINWILKGVTNIVFNKNLESYLKTYDEVRRNAIVTNSLTPDSWATWCLERYDCDGAITSKSSNSTDIRK